jgi:hypothetical protein
MTCQENTRRTLEDTLAFLSRVYIHKTLRIGGGMQPTQIHTHY